MQAQGEKLGQALQLFQAGIGDLVAPRSSLGVVSAPGVAQPTIRNVGAGEVERLEAGQLLELLQPGIGYFGDARWSVWRLVNALSCSSPASVTLVRLRSRLCRLVSPLRCRSPASVT